MIKRNDFSFLFFGIIILRFNQFFFRKRRINFSEKKYLESLSVNLFDTGEIISSSWMNFFPCKSNFNFENYFSSHLHYVCELSSDFKIYSFASAKRVSPLFSLQIMQEIHASLLSVPWWKAFVINNGLTCANSSKPFVAKQGDENRSLGTSGDKCEKVCHKGGCFLRRSLRNILQRWSGQFWTLDKHVGAIYALSRKLVPRIRLF